MLKILPTLNLSNPLHAKCGEIFHQNFKNFTIFCTFCEIKSFQFEDFMLHLQNQHLDTISLKPEILESKLPSTYEYEKDSYCHNEQCRSPKNEISENTDESEMEELVVLKRNLNKSRNMSKNRRDIINKSRPQNNNKRSELNTASNSKKSVSEAVYKCIECNLIYNQKKTLDQHVIEVHSGYKCSKCDKRFRRSYHLSGHLKTHQSIKKFVCSIENCSRRFSEDVYLKRHLEVHTLERTFLCDYENCGKAFHTQRRLNTHKYTHRMSKKLVCDMCGHSCRSNTELVTHQRVHTGEKPFSCTNCNKPFISKTALTEHMISHSDIKPHVCTICKAAFANRRVLVRHSFTHSDEKTFKCKICEKAFRHPNSLQGHVRYVHHKAKKYRTSDE